MSIWPPVNAPTYAPTRAPGSANVRATGPSVGGSSSSTVLAVGLALSASVATATASTSSTTYSGDASASATSSSTLQATVTSIDATASATSSSSLQGTVQSPTATGHAHGVMSSEGTANGSVATAAQGHAHGVMSSEGTANGSVAIAAQGHAHGVMSSEGTANGSVSAGWANTRSIQLDGANDYAELASDVAVGTTWTYSTWLKPATYSSSSLFGYLAAENNDGGAGGTATRHGIGFVQSGTTNGGSGMVYYYSQTGTGSTQLSSTALTANAWNHIVITADVSNNQLKIYLNGSLDNTITKSNIQTVFDSLGRYSNLWYYNGKMDEVAFWDTILSATEVTAIYNSGTPTDLGANAGNYSSSSNLIGWWRMEEGSGTTVADSSTNSNTATLTNGPTFSTDVV